MSLWEILIISFGVSLDAFAVSMAGALLDREHPARHAALAALFFGGFQILMPLGGFALSVSFRETVTAFDRYIAFTLLLFVGGKMVVDAFRNENETLKESPFNWRPMTVLAVATSLDAAAVGASLALIGESVPFPALSMGIVTGVVSACGVFLGHFLGHQVNSRFATAAGGLAIIGIGVKILVEHLLA